MDGNRLGRSASRRRVISLVAALGLVAGCTSSTEHMSESTSTATVGSEPQVSTITPASSLATSAASDPDELVGMRAYTDWGAGPAVGYEGVLVIEYPCAYLYPRDNKELLYPSENNEIPDLGASVAPPGERALLLLVRDWTDYDPETNTLRFRELHYVADTDSYMIGAEGSGEGPIASGDQIDLAGVSRPIQGHEDVCQRDFDINVDRISLCGLHVCQMEREARRHADTSR